MGYLFNINHITKQNTKMISIYSIVLIMFTKQKLNINAVIKYLPNVAAIIICFIMLYRIRTSALFGDDWPNSYNGYWVRYLYPDSTNLFSIWIKDSLIWTDSWIQRAGRIIPVGLLLARIFILLPNIELYKLMQILSIIIVLISIIKLLSIYLERKVNFAIITLSFMIFLQFRNDYDPYIGFTFILPISIICILGTAIYLLKIDQSVQPKLRWYLVIFILPLISALTYEYTILLTPIFFFILLKNKILNLSKLKIILISVSGPLILALIQIFIVRPKRLIQEGTYESNLNFAMIIKTSIKQLVAVLPNSQAIFSKIPNPNFSMFIYLLILLLIIPIIYAFFKDSTQNRNFIFSNLGPLAAVGIWFLIAPPILVGVSKQWQELLGLGNAYLPIFYQHVGATILLFILFSRIRSYFISSKISTSTLISLVSIVVIASPIALSMTFQLDSNNRLLFNDNYKTNRFEMLKFAINKGLMRDVVQGSTIISYDTNDTHEINRAVFSVESGVDLSDMKLPSQIWSTSCLEDVTCPLSIELNEFLKNQIRSSNDSEVNLKVPFKLPIDGISSYYGERYKVNQISKPYFLDALYYSNTSVLYTISPIRITLDDVLIDRNSGTAVWVSLDENNPFLPKRMTETSCLVSSEINRDALSNTIWSVASLSEFGETNFRSSQNGQFC